MSPTFVYFKASYDFADVNYTALTEDEKALMTLAVLDKFCATVGPTMCALIVNVYVAAVDGWFKQLADGSSSLRSRQGGTKAVLLFANSVEDVPETPVLSDV